jgi:thiamine biosynthesis lipoprotein
MAAQNELQLHAQDEALAERAARDAIAEIQRIEAKYSRYRPESVLSRINAAAGRERIEIDEETRSLLGYADACWRESGGLFDATSGVLRRAWRFDGKRVPTDEELRPLLRSVGWRRVSIDDAGIRMDAGMELDFGGFGKEYAVDRAALRLGELGIRSALVSLAGDLTILGAQPDGSPWRVGIQHPRKPGALAAQLPVFSGAIATSGDYERFIEVDGVRHCHVLDPRTGRSVQGFQSVTVHAASCLVAGSAATIAMLKGREAGLDWLGKLALPHLCVLDDGSVLDRMEPEGPGL